MSIRGEKKCTDGRREREREREREGKSGREKKPLNRILTGAGEKMSSN